MLLDRWATIPLLAILILLCVLFNNNIGGATQGVPESPKLVKSNSKPPLEQSVRETVDWGQLPDRYPLTNLQKLPVTNIHELPRVQATFAQENEHDRAVRVARLAAVKSNFSHAWNGYKTHAWLRDEVQPVSGNASDPFGGWAATAIDALDTLWIMDMKDEFDAAVAAVASIDFSTTTLDKLNVFETTIRHLGGLLAAFDLSGDEILLTKAKQLGNMLYKAFDTPNRMPITQWKHKDAAQRLLQEVPYTTLLAEVASLTLEFTRLSQLTGDNRYFDAVQRVADLLDKQQMITKLPGLWPVNVDLREQRLDHHGVFSIGGRSDSTYEYLIKQHILLGGATDQYAGMYNRSLQAMKDHLFFHPAARNSAQVLFAGEAHSQSRGADGRPETRPRLEHLSCFAGGMVLLGAKTLQSPADIEVGKQLTEGCLSAYEAMDEGIMPEIVHVVPCNGSKTCGEGRAHSQQTADGNSGHSQDVSASQRAVRRELPAGVVRVEDPRYLLRPEAIESVFIQYRITADRTLQDRAWTMFNSIVSKTKTDIAHAALKDCTVPDPPKEDRMESFWLAETLKYFYLIFSEPDVVSLDRYVLNTEAHPLRRPM